MMIFSLVLGVVIGAVSILFILQNITTVTVSFFAYQLTGSLAVILFLAVIAGMLMSVFILLPSLIRDMIEVSKLKKQNQTLSEELAAQKEVIVESTEV